MCVAYARALTGQPKWRREFLISVILDRLFSVPTAFSLPTALPHCAPQRHQRRQRALLLGDGHLVVGTALNARFDSARRVLPAHLLADGKAGLDDGRIGCSLLFNYRRKTTDTTADGSRKYD